MRWNPIPLEFERAHLKVSRRIAGLFLGAHQFVTECAEEGEPIFVAPDIPAVYFVSDRTNPSPYDLTIPGNVDGHLIMARLEATATKCIVYNPQMYPEFPPFRQLFPQLARYLAQNFEKQAVFRGGESEWWGLVRKTR